MRAFALVGLAFVVLGAALLIVMRAPDEEGPTAALWLQGFSVELDAYAARHDGRFPVDFEDVVLDVGSSAHAAFPVDPWGHPYVYERHPDDARQCRVYTLGDLATAAEPDGAGALALYRDRDREHWRRDLDDVPRAWREALVQSALGED